MEKKNSLNRVILLQQLNSKVQRELPFIKYISLQNLYCNIRLTTLEDVLSSLKSATDIRRNVFHSEP